MRQIGAGNTADVFIYDEGRILKLYKKGYGVGGVKREQQNVKMVEALGVPSPKCYDLIWVDERPGLIYDRVTGQTLLDDLVKGGDAEEDLRVLVDLHKQLLEKALPDAMDYRDYLHMYARHMDAALDARIDALPSGDIFCHGDYHFGNVMRDDNGAIFLIDFMNICKGPRLFDIARTYFLTGFGGDMDNVDMTELRRLQKLLSEAYLKGMGVDYEEIRPFVDVIRDCRYFEMGGK